MLCSPFCGSALCTEASGDMPARGRVAADAESMSPGPNSSRQFRSESVIDKATAVLFGVLGSGHELKVFGPVIGLDVVDVVDGFGWAELSPKNSLHHDAVQIPVTHRRHDLDVAILGSSVADGHQPLRGGMLSSPGRSPRRHRSFAVAAFVLSLHRCSLLVDRFLAPLMASLETRFGGVLRHAAGG